MFVFAIGTTVLIFFCKRIIHWPYMYFIHTLPFIWKVVKIPLIFNDFVRSVIKKYIVQKFINEYGKLTVILSLIWTLNNLVKLLWFIKSVHWPDSFLQIFTVQYIRTLHVLCITQLEPKNPNWSELETGNERKIVHDKMELRKIFY